mmetsp:Transcript_11884/g.24216  ORF Transcript_11884/g.24216 Transcript_11884/m.24216 type:complete len:137 (+) Transcript_11884:876-1286(+)
MLLAAKQTRRDYLNAFQHRARRLDWWTPPVLLASSMIHADEVQMSDGVQTPGQIWPYITDYFTKIRDRGLLQTRRAQQKAGVLDAELKRELYTRVLHDQDWNNKRLQLEEQVMKSEVNPRTAAAQIVDFSLRPSGS